MFKSKFNFKKVKMDTLISPVTGKIIDLKDVPDPVFSQKMMGDGIAILPLEGEIVAPMDGEIVQLFPTKHAVGIKTENGLEILIHIGLDTVELGGEGFTTHVTQGEKVTAGQLLISFNLLFVEEKVRSTVIPIILTNSGIVSEITYTEEKELAAGKDTLMKAILSK